MEKLLGRKPGFGSKNPVPTVLQGDVVRRRTSCASGPILSRLNTNVRISGGITTHYSTLKKENIMRTAPISDRRTSTSSPVGHAHSPARRHRFDRTIGFWLGGAVLGAAGCIIGAAMASHPVGVMTSMLWWGIYFGCFGASVGALLGLFTEKMVAFPSPVPAGTGEPMSRINDGTLVYRGPHTAQTIDHRPLAGRTTGAVPRVVGPIRLVAHTVSSTPDREPAAGLEVTTVQVADGLVIRVKGEAGVESTAALRDSLLVSAGLRPDLVTLDLSELRSISSLAMGVLVTFRRGVVRTGGRVHLAEELQPAVHEALARAELFDLFETITDAGRRPSLADSIAV
jgi:anti-anti-sigma factor